MKSKLKKMIIASLILSGGLMTKPTFADPPGMPDNHGQSGDQIPGGGAPLNGGLFILLTAAGAYSLSYWRRKTPDYQIEE